MIKIRFRLTACFILMLLVFTPAYAGPGIQGQQPMHSSDQAFVLSWGREGDNTLIAHWQIAKGYHLYKDRIHIKSQSNQTQDARLGIAQLPKGIPQHDDILGNYEIYRGDLTVRVPVVDPGNGLLRFSVAYQGCRGTLECYPPVKRNVQLHFKSLPVLSTTISKNVTSNHYVQLIGTHSVFVLLAIFLGIGILLAFTPCVLPMIPILSGIILGQGRPLSTGRAFSLTLVYVLGMSLTFAVAGIFAGYAGHTLQAMLQTPFVLVLFALLLVLLALSAFGLYELQLPSFLRDRLHAVSGSQRSGSYVGAAVMGGLATLIASPCVTAPLVGLLVYIGSTGNAVLGGSALFAMGVGMGLPLLAFGTLGGRFLPRAGRWMMVVRILFGVLLLAMAAWMAMRIPVFTVHAKSNGFHTVYSLNQLDIELNAAKHQHRPVLLDYYADWCFSCKEMDAHVFKVPAMRKAMRRFVLLRADVTSNNRASRLLQSRYHVFAPPSLRFFDIHGHLVKGAGIAGRVGVQALLKDIRDI